MSFSLRVEAEIDELRRRERVERDDRADERIARRELAAEASPARCRRGSVPNCGVPAAEEEAHGAVGRLEAVLHVERLPRAALLVLGERRAVRVGVALRAHVGLARDRAALQVLRAAGRTRGRSSRWRGCTGPRSPIPEFMPISLRIGPLTIAIVANDVVLLERAVMPLAAQREDDRQVLGPRARHDRVDRDLLDRELPELAERGRPQAPDDLVAARWLVPASIASTRSSVGSTIGRKSVQRFSTNSRWRLSSVSASSSARRRALERQALRGPRRRAAGQALDHVLHERAAVDRVLPSM